MGAEQPEDGLPCRILTLPTEVDYDCEVCCRPMTIVFTEDDVYARGLAD